MMSMLEKVARYFSADGMAVDMDTDYGTELHIVDPWDDRRGIIIERYGAEIEVSLVQGGHYQISKTVRAPSARAVIKAVRDIAAAENYTISYSNFS